MLALSSMPTKNLKKSLRVSSSDHEIPGPNASELEKVTYEHAKLYAAYKQRGQEIKDLEAMCNKYIETFGYIERLLKGVLLN
jgi:hypothetical protein